MSGQQENEQPKKRPNHYQNIRIENVSQSPIAFGGDAILNIYQHFEAPKPPRPDYINMAPDLKHFVERPNEYNQLRQKLISPEGEIVAISAALRGAGGFGKTTLAQRLCYDETVQQAFPDGILWVELGERPDNLVGKVNDLTDVLTGGRPTVVELNAAAAELAHALGEKRCLMVIDDLWNAAHATPFLRRGPNCTRLITTRNADTLPTGVESINVDTMRQNEALAMLVRELPGWESLAVSFARLVSRLGEWPLLLKLANSALYRRAEQQELEKALAYVDKALVKRGLTAFDAKNPVSRGQAVAATLGVSLAELDEAEQQRFRELAVFPEDTDIPLAAVTTLWQSTGNLDDFDTEELCDTLFDRSLLLRYDGRTLRLHDVIRQYLLDHWTGQTYTLHQKLLTAYNPTGDWPAGPDDGYYFQNLAYHLNEAGKTADLSNLLLNFTWLEIKLNTTNITQLLADYQILHSQKSVTEPAQAEPTEGLTLVEGALRLSSHILARNKKQLAFQLRGRLLSFNQPEIISLCTQAGEWSGGIWLSPLSPVLNPPGGPLIRTLEGHSAGVQAVAVSADGHWVISASKDKTLKVWNLGTGAEERTLIGHSAEVRAVAVTPDGRKAVSASDDETLKVWDMMSPLNTSLETGVEERTLAGHSYRVNSVAVTPDGRWAISASDDETLKVWNMKTGVEERTLVGHLSIVNAVAVTPDGRRAVSASLDQTLKVWNLETGAEEQTLTGHTLGVLAVAVTPDGQRAVSASLDQTIKVWDISTKLNSSLETGAEERTLTGHSSSVLAVAVTPDGRKIVSASEDQTLKVWNLETGAEESTLVGHSDWVRAVAVTGSELLGGWLAVSASNDMTLKVWDISTPPNSSPKTGNEERTLARHSNWVRAVAVTPDGRRVISASNDRTLKTWDISPSLNTSLKPGTTERTLLGHSSIVRSVAVLPDGRRAVSASLDRTMRLWNLETGTEERTVASFPYISVNSVVVTPDGQRAISASRDEALKVWDISNESLEMWTEERTLTGHSDWVWAVVVTPDGQRAVSASSDRTLKVWNLETGVEEWTLTGHSNWVRAVAVTPDGRRAVSASRDQTLKVWNLETGAEERMLVGHTSSLLAVVVMPDSQRVVSASNDATLKVWDILTGNMVATYDLDHIPTCLAVTPNGRIIIVGDQSGQLLWLALHTTY